MDFPSPTGDLPNNYNYNNKNNEEIKLNEGDDKKMNKQIFPINLLIDNEIFYQIKYLKKKYNSSLIYYFFTFL